MNESSVIQTLASAVFGQCHPPFARSVSYTVMVYVFRPSLVQLHYSRFRACLAKFPSRSIHESIAHDQHTRTANHSRGLPGIPLSISASACCPPTGTPLNLGSGRGCFQISGLALSGMRRTHTTSSASYASGSLVTDQPSEMLTAITTWYW